MVVLAKQALGEILSAMELIDSHSLDVVLRQKAWGLRSPLQDQYPFYMLLETSGSDGAHDAEKVGGRTGDKGMNDSYRFYFRLTRL